MKGLAVLLSATTFLSLAGVARSQTSKSGTDMVFIENKGQWSPRVRFLGRAPGVDMWITDQGITYDYHNSAKKLDSHVVRISFIGSESQVRTQVNGLQRKPYTLSYFLGSDKSKWASHVPVYSSAKVKGIYPGIDLVAYFDQQKKLPRYDYVVNPGANPASIRARYEGAAKLHLTAGGTIGYETRVGRVEERDLVAYQRTQGSSTRVPARMCLAADGTVKVSVGGYDPRKSLVIDPLIWSSFLGGSMGERVTGIASDSDSVLVAGTTTSSDFPASTGASSASNFNPCLFVSRFSSDGKQLLSSAVIGSSVSQGASGLTVDGNGNVTVGTTVTSSNYPTTLSAFQPDFPGSQTGAITKLTSDLDDLVYSTFLGPAGTTLGAFTSDSTGAIYAVGQAPGPGLGTAGAFMSNPAGSFPGFCVKLSPDGSSLVFGSYLSGSSTFQVKGRGVALDQDKNVYVTGETQFPQDFPTTAGVYQATARSFFKTGFVSKFSADGSTLLASTFLGGSGSDAPSQIAVSSDGCVVAGAATSSDFPTTANAYLASQPSSSSVFVAKLSPGFDQLQYGSYYGNSFLTQINALTLDSSGNAIIGGSVVNSGLPVTTGAYQPIFPSLAFFGSSGFIAKLSTSGSSLLYSSYLGGSDRSEIEALATGPNGYTYLAGSTSSIDFPTTIESYQIFLQGANAFVGKMDLAPETSLGFSPMASDGSVPITGTVYLPAANGTSTLVRLKSSSSAVTVPATITIPAGCLSGDFPLTLHGVDETTLVDIMATTPTAKTDRYVMVRTPVVSGLRLSPSEVLGGAKNSVGTVTLSGPAGPTGFLVTLSNSNPSAAVVPSGVIVPHGRTSITFPITSKVVTSQQGVAVTAAAGGVAWANLVVDPLVPATLILPKTIYTGYTLTGTVRLGGPAPSTGFVVTLTSSDPTRLTVPARVLVPGASTSATFDITAKDSYVGAPKTVTIAATNGSNAISGTTTLTTLAPTTFTVPGGTLYSGNTRTGTLTLNATAPAPLVIALTSTDPANLPVPATVTVPAGARVVSFPFTLADGYAGAGTTTLRASARGVTLSKDVVVAGLSIARIAASPNSVKGGSVNTTLTISLSSRAGIAQTVALSSDNPAITIPSTVTIPAGAQSASIEAVSHAVVAKTSVHITATYRGKSVSAAISVTK